MPDSTYDFLDAPEPSEPAAAPPHRRPAGWMSTAAWLVAGLVLGALVVAMLHTNNSASATGPAANQAPNGAAAGGGFPLGPGGGLRGGLPGEQHIVGTLTAVGPSSITVTGNGGSASYPIESSTLLVKNGQRVSSPSALTVGDIVVVHVYPQNGSTHTEMVIDGVPNGPGDDDGGRDDNTGTTTET